MTGPLPGQRCGQCRQFLWLLVLWLALASQLVDAVTTVRVLVPSAFNQDNWATQRNLTTAFAARTGIQVEFVTLATAITDYTATAVNTMFVTKDAFVDILALDVVWIGDYGEYLLPLDGDADLAAVLAQHNPQNVAAGTYDGQLKAVPQNADYGLLYSRMDLLNRYGYSAPPTTYQEMEQMMEKIVPEEKKTNPAFFGISNQVSTYEGLTCNALEWTYAENAGVILESDRTLSSFDQKSTIGQRVLSIGKRMRKWYANGWMTIGLTEWSSGREWIRGNVLFHRNWPYMSVYTRDSGVSWPWRLTSLPAGGAALGGWLWGANKYTKNPEATKRVLELFASIEWQKSRAVFEGASPTIPALYNDSQVCSVLPICELVQQLKIARRPSSASGVKYPEVSKAIFTRWFDIVRGIGGTVESILDIMNRDIAKILGIDILGPPTNIAMGNGAVAAFSAIAGIEIIALAAALGWFVFLKHTPVAHNIGLAFLFPITTGLVMQLIMVFMTAGTPDSATCHARFWIHGIGYSLAIMSLAARLFSMWSTSSNPFITERSLPVQTAAFALGPSVVTTTALLIGFSTSNSIGANEVKLPTSRYIGCVSGDPAVNSIVNIVWYCWLGAQMLATFWVGIKASSLATAPPEARTLKVCIANATFMPVTLIPFVELDLVEQPTAYILRSLTVVFLVGLFIGVYLAPRAWLALEYWRNPSAAAEKDTVGQSHMMGSSMTTSGSELATFVATAVPSGGGGKLAAQKASRGVRSSAVKSSSEHADGLGASSIATSQQAPVLDLKKLVKSTLKELDVGCEGIVAVRRSDRSSLLSFMPWTLERGYFLPDVGLLVFQHLSNPTSMSHGTCIPLSHVKNVSQSKPNEFTLDLDGGFLQQVMVSTAEETKKWTMKIERSLQTRQT